jgi:hypothetical protein
MGEVYPMPTVGDLFTDVRGDDRTMRVSYHEHRGVIVVSLWAGTVCRGSFQLAADDAPRLAAVLAQVKATPGTPADAATSTADAETSTALPQPAPEQTGDVSRSALPMPGVPRVA